MACRSGSASHSSSRTGPAQAANIGTEAAVRGPADGHTLLYWSLELGCDQRDARMTSLNFNFIRDIAPVAGVVRVPNPWLCW